MKNYQKIQLKNCQNHGLMTVPKKLQEKHILLKQLTPQNQHQLYNNFLIHNNIIQLMCLKKQLKKNNINVIMEKQLVHKNSLFVYFSLILKIKKKKEQIIFSKTDYFIEECQLVFSQRNFYSVIWINSLMIFVINTWIIMT